MKQLLGIFILALPLIIPSIMLFGVGITVLLIFIATFAVACFNFGMYLLEDE